MFMFPRDDNLSVALLSYYLGRKATLLSLGCAADSLISLERIDPLKADKL